MRRAFLGVLLGYGAWRLLELRRSRKNERGLERRGVPRRPERGFPWMVAAHVMPFVLGPIESARRRRPPPRALTVAAGVALVGAAALRLWAQASLGEGWSVHVRAAPGMRIVARGPYRWVRHPNYAAVIVELAALPLVGGAWATALAASLLNALALARRIPDEERALAASPAWRQEMARKPRFVPTLH
jgi:methyltransferase